MSRGLLSTTPTPLRRRTKPFGIITPHPSTSDYSAMKFTTSGNVLTITSPTAPTGNVTVSASKKDSKRMGLVVWDDGTFGPGVGQQNTVTYTQSVTDPIAAYLKLNVSYGSAKIVKTSEDGKVEGITFRITGNGIDQTVTTNSRGEVQIDNLQPGEYTVTEQVSGDYVPQEPQNSGSLIPHSMPVK